MAVIKLPKYDTQQISTTYKPRYTASTQSGLFGKPNESDSFNPFGKPQEELVTVTETEKRIQDLERQVQNLETRLTESGATDEEARSGLEKFLNLPAGQVWWMDAFEIIDRPLQTLKYGIAEGSLKEAYEAWKGNREFMSGSEFLVNIGAVDQANLQYNNGLKLFLDIGFDVFADPLNYIAPIKLLKKLGILSDTKAVTKLDDVIRTLRKEGLLQLTDEAITTALTGARRAAEEALQQAGKSADEIAVILGKNIDEWDDVARTAYNASLEAAGVLDDAGFVTMLDNFGQTIDDQGRVVFKSDIANARQVRQNLADAMDEFRRVNPASKIKSAKAAARQIAKRAEIARNALRTNQEIIDFAARTNMSVDDAIRFAATGTMPQGATVPLTDAIGIFRDKFGVDARQITELDALATKLQDAATAVDGLPKLKPGEVMEQEVTIKTRELLQNQTDKIFDDVIVVAGDARGKADDLVLWVKDKKTGNYIQLRNADGTAFKFEIKDPNKFSLLNSNLRAVNKETISETAQKLRDKTFRNTPEGQKLYQEWLEDVAIYRNAGGNPTFAISRTGEIAKLGEEVVGQFNKLLGDVLVDVNKGAYTMSEYFKYLDDFYKKYDEVAALHPNWKTADIIKEAEKAVFANAPEGLSRTITVGAANDVGRNAAKEMLKLKQVADPTNAYGMIIKNADGVEELIILQPNDFFEYVQLKEISVQSVKRSSGTTQSKMAVYMELDPANVPEAVRNNSWFTQALKETTEEVTEKTLKVTQEYKAGLIVRMLNGVGKTKIPFIAPAADLIAKAVDGFTFLFNSTKGLGDDLTEFLAKIPAEDLQAAKVSITKVDNLVKDIVKATKGKYSEDFVRSTIQRLLEEGWDGVSVAGRRMSFSEIAKRWAIQYRKAGKAQFVAFANDVDFINFQDILVDILRREGKADDFIKLRKVDGATIVEFADGVTAKEIDEFVNALSPQIAQQSIDLGKAGLTSEQLLFAKEFNEQIQQIVSESVSQQNMLRRLGFDFSDGTLGTGAYFRHSINPQMLQFLRGKSPASIKKFLNAGTDMLRDRIYIGSVDEINKGVKELFGINVNLFSSDVAFNFADLVRVASTKNEMDQVLRALLNSQDTIGRELFEVIDDIEYTARGMKSNFKILDNSFKAEFPNLFKNLSPEAQNMLLKYFADKGFAEGASVIAVQKAAYGVLKRLDNAYVVLPEFIQNYDQFMRFWKTFALITPGYHMRNFFGNMTNSFMAGMPMSLQGVYMFRTSSDFTQYRQVLKMLQRGEDVSNLPRRVVEAFKRVDDYFRSGASQSHRGVRDLEIIKEGIRIARGQERNVAQKVGDALLNFNYKSAEMMDDMQRYSLYRWSYDNAGRSSRVRAAQKAGASLNEVEALRKSEAYRKVSEALFDYSHLTPFEQEYMKRLFPFYTFMKNNLIFQAKSFFERPQQYGKLYRSYKYYTEDMTGMQLEDLPNYMTDNLWLPMPYRVTKDNTEAIEWLRLNLPPSDFTEFIENPFARGVTSLTVPIKFFIEMGTNRDLFTGQQIREFPGEQSIYREEGFLSNLRDERGRLTLSTNPYTIKFLNDIGFRSLFSYGTAAIDLIDYQQGNITREDMTRKIADALGLTRQQTLDDMQIASLYQNLDRARDLKDFYEQENDGSLPTLKELAELTQQEEAQGSLFSNLFS